MNRWIVAVTVLSLSIGFLLWLRHRSQIRPELGPINGHLRMCPSTPNCARMELPLLSAGKEASWKKLQNVMQELPRSVLVLETDKYLHAECHSQYIGFVDDVEALLHSKSETLELRSASRVGYSDLGVNRKRLQLIKERYLD